MSPLQFEDDLVESEYLYGAYIHHGDSIIVFLRIKSVLDIRGKDVPDAMSMLSEYAQSFEKTKAVPMNRPF